MEYVEFTGSSLSNEKCIRTRRGNAGRGSENSCCSVAAIQLHVSQLTSALKQLLVSSI